MPHLIAVLTSEELKELVKQAVREELARAKPPAITRRYLDPGEIATHFGVSRGTVRNWVKEGCPHSSHGKLLRFELEIVEQWFRGNGSEARRKPLRRSRGA